MQSANEARKLTQAANARFTELAAEKCWQAIQNATSKGQSTVHLAAHAFAPLGSEAVIAILRGLGYGASFHCGDQREPSYFTITW